MISHSTESMAQRRAICFWPSLSLSTPPRSAAMLASTTESTRNLEARVAVNEQLSAIGHLAAPFRRAKDHLAGELPAPNCAHDKLALSCSFASSSKPTREPFKQQQTDRSTIRFNVVALLPQWQLETKGFVARSPRARKKNQLEPSSAGAPAGSYQMACVI